jgi:microcin C transport system substrate-binding protein
MNKQLFFGQYKRINSYFDGTELASSGLPQGQELQILETVRDKVPAGSLHHSVYQSGEWKPRERARQSARSDAPAERGGLRDP